MSISGDDRGQTVEREGNKRAGENLHEQTHTLTVRHFFVRHVVARREAVFGHGHVGVEGEGQQARGGLDLWRDLCPTVTSNQRRRWKQIKTVAFRY